MMLSIACLVLLLGFSSGCGSENRTEQDQQELNGSKNESLAREEKTYIPAASDQNGWRDYYFASNTIEEWITPDGINVINVWVRIDYNNNPGVAVRDVQHWHIDYKNNRYKVSDDFSYDVIGRPLDLCYHSFEEVSWRAPMAGTTIVSVLASIKEFIETE